MEYRRLGRSGLYVSAMTLGTMTFGGRGDFGMVGSTDVATATRQVDACLDAGVNLFDTADMYSDGESEEILGQAISGRRDRLLLATKARMAVGDGPNETGLSRQHLIRQCEASLRRLGTDYIDLYQTHEWDGITPLEETLEALDTLVRSGKVRYVGCSNLSGWHLMKALGVSDRLGLQRYVSQQIYYSLEARDAEYELVPLAVDQECAILVWSPLAGGLLSGKYRRDEDAAEGRHVARLGRAASPRPRETLRHHRRACRDRRRSRRFGGTGSPGLAARPTRRSLRSRRRPHRRTATRQPRRRRPAPLRRGAHPTRPRQRPTTPLPLLAPGQTASDRLSPADLTLLGPHLD